MCLSFVFAHTSFFRVIRLFYCDVYVCFPWKELCFETHTWNFRCICYFFAHLHPSSNVYVRFVPTHTCVSWCLSWYSLPSHHFHHACVFFLITHTSECTCTRLIFWHIPRFLRAYISFTTTYTFENRRVPHVFTHRQRFISTCVVLNSRIHHISDVCVDIVLRCLFFCAYISCMTTCMFNSRRIPFVFRRIHRFISTFVENTLCWWIVMGVYVCKSRLCLC